MQPTEIYIIQAVTSIFVHIIHSYRVLDTETNCFNVFFYYTLSAFVWLLTCFSQNYFKNSTKCGHLPQFFQIKSHYKLDSCDRYTQNLLK